MDDIDIVEHNILDDPRIKDIFLDPSMIKKELLDDDIINENDYDTQVEHNKRKTQDCDAVSKVNSSNVYNIGSDAVKVGNEIAGIVMGEDEESCSKEEKPLVVLSEVTFGDSVTNINLNRNEAIVKPNLPQNIIDNNESTKKVINNVNVGVVSNLRTKVVINNIPNEIVLGSKSIQAKVSKEYLPAIVDLKDWGVILKASKRYCHECKILFPTINSIDRHKVYHSENNLDNNSSVHNYESSEYKDNERSRKRKLNSDECLQSAKIFRDASNKVGNIPKTYFDDTVIGEKCYHCDKYFIDNAALIDHLYTTIENDEIIEQKSSDNIFQCELCGQQFSNETLAKFHKRFIHPNHSGDFIKVKANTIDENTDINDLVKDKNDFEYKFMGNIIIKNPPIPISVLFKCNKCNLHFITANNAYDHSKTCNITKYVSCTKCKRSFRQCDMKIHERQHLLNKSFKVYTIRVNLLSKLLCRCPKCGVCFCESLFWKHLQSPCVSKYRYCKKCNLKIHKLGRIGHICSHDNIVIDYVNNIETKVKNINKYNKRTSMNIYRQELCEICNMVYSNNPGRFHICRVNKNNGVYCRLCCTRFSYKFKLKHTKLHNEKQLDINNLLFFSIQKQKFIPPPMPKYEFCSKCKIYYLRPHRCCSLKYKRCDCCSKNFNKEHYDLHKQFHLYNMNNLIRVCIENGGYEGYKTPLLIFYCVKCNCYVSGYDKVMRHAQNHLTKQMIEKKQCEKCHNTFECASYDNHNHNIEKYKIIKFDYEHLLTKKWFDIFYGLDQVQIGNILKYSLFKDTRSLGLTLVQKGDYDKTIYVCPSCNVIIEKTDLEKHVLNPYCTANPKYKCELCDLYCNSSESMEVHRNLHIAGVNKKNFHIISFKDIGIKPVNTKLVTKDLVIKIPKCDDEIWFKRKVHGDKDISINNIKAHEADSDVDNNESENDDDNSTTPEIYANVKEIIIYKCSDCKNCNFTKKYLNEHCCNKTALRFCDLCRQFYNCKNWKYHELVIHSNNQNIIFKINYFKMKTVPRIGLFAHIFKVVDKLYSKNKRYKSTSKKIIFNTDSASVEISQDKVEPTTNNEKSFEDAELANNIRRKIMTLYKCSRCKTCVATKLNSKRHKCDIKLYNRFCNICQQWISMTTMRSHIAKHKGNKKNNISIIHFNPKSSVYKARFKKSSLLSFKRVERTAKSDIRKNDVTHDSDEKHINKDNKEDYSKSEDVKDTSVVDDRNKKKDVNITKARYTNETYEDFSDTNEHVSEEENICKLNEKGKMANFNRMTKHVNYTDITSISSKEKLILEAIKVAADNDSDKDISTKGIINTKPVVKKLLRCVSCNLCNLYERYIKNITNSHRCVSAAKQWYCRMCKQSFTGSVYNKHLKSYCNGQGNSIQVIDFKPKIFVETPSPTPRTTRSKHVKQLSTDISNTNDENNTKETADINKDSNNEKVDDVDVSIAVTKDVEVFKCSNCSICVRKRVTYDHHCLTEDGKRYCEECKQFYSAHHFARHINWHTENKEKKINLKVLNFSPMEIKYTYPNRKKEEGKQVKTDLNVEETKYLRVYKCVYCKNCYFNNGNIYRHICIVSDKLKIYCELCEQTYTTRNFIQHKKIHNDFNNIKLNVRYFEPRRVSYGKFTNNINASREKRYEVYICNVCDICFLSRGTRKKHQFSKHKVMGDVKRCRYCRLRFPMRSLYAHLKHCPWADKSGFIRIIEGANKEKIYKWDDTVLPDKDPEIYTVYRCSICDICYLNNGARKSHTRLSNHILKSEVKSCRYCNLRFSKLSFRNHEWECPWKDKRCHIVVVNHPSKDKYIHKWDESSNGEKSKDSETFDKDTKENGKGILDNNSYQSTDNLSNETETYNCYDQANLEANNSYTGEVKTSEESNNSALKEVTTDNDCCIYLESNSTCGKEKTQNSEISKYKNIKESSEHSEGHLNDEKFELQMPKVSNISQNSNEIKLCNVNIESKIEKKELDDLTMVKDVESKSVTPNAQKLYLCNACNVYFLDEKCCQAHVLSHAILNPRDYIQCKLCLLLFLTVDLHLHVIKHHDNEFNFDIIVEEFSPSDNNSVIYNLKDKLQSLDVSTTCEL